MITIWQEIRYALRILRFSPGFATVAILSLALGTGANTAIFQLLDAISLRTLPVYAPQELVELRIDDMDHARGSWLRDSAVTNPLWEKIRERRQAFSRMFAWADESFEVSQDGELHNIPGLWVSGDFFPALGIQPRLGRLFTPADDQRSCGLTPGAVISYGFWRQGYGGDPSIIGREVLIGKNRIPIVGVTPPEFFGLEVGRTFDVALPLCSEPILHNSRPILGSALNSGTIWWLTVMGRLKSGVSIEKATAILQADSPGIFEATLPAGYPQVSVKPYLRMKLFAIPAGHGISRVRQQYSTALVLLLAITALVLLIACANLANLMLARAATRRRDVAVQLAMGATRARLARQVATEGLLLSVMGATFGLFLAQVLTRVLIAFLSTRDNPTFVAFRMDFHIFSFEAAMAILTCLGFVSAPVLRASETDPGEVLKSGSRSVTSTRGRLGRVLVGSQIAVSLLLLVGTLSFVRTLRNLNKLDPGFQLRGILVADLSFSDMQLSPAQNESLRRTVLDRLRAIPDVTAASEATMLPLTGGNWNNRAWMDGSDPATGHVARRSMIGDQYFRTLKTPLIFGREFNQHDLTTYAKVAIVNQEFVRQWMGGQNPVGRYFWVEATPYASQTAFEIVGVVGNTKYSDLREEFQPIMFMPIWQPALQRSADRIIIRSNTMSQSLVSSVRRTLADFNSNMRYSFHFFDTWVQDALVRERLMAAVSTLFGVLALMLTTVGLYGVISYTVKRRTNEIGIRIALGADRRSVITLMLREVGAVLIFGLVIGILLTILMGRPAVALLYGVGPHDPLTVIVAAFLLFIVAGLASYVPARRASSMNPVSALRHD